MQVVKPGPDRETPRGVVGGSEISQATTGARDIYMGRFRVPPGAQSRPHYHDGCESALYMLAGSIEIRWGDHLEEQLVVEPGDMLYVPPRITHSGATDTSSAKPANHSIAEPSNQGMPGARQTEPDAGTPSTPIRPVFHARLRRRPRRPGRSRWRAGPGRL